MSFWATRSDQPPHVKNTMNRMISQSRIVIRSHRSAMTSPAQDAIQPICCNAADTLSVIDWFHVKVHMRNGAREGNGGEYTGSAFG